LASRVGERARTALLGEVARSVFQLEPIVAADVQAALAVITRHADLAISLADASITVLAARHQTQTC